MSVPRGKHEPADRGWVGYLNVLMGRCHAYNGGRLDGYRDSEELHGECMVTSSGKPINNDQDRASEFAAALIHLHHRKYGTWPDADRVRGALVALGVLVNDTTTEET